MINVISLGLGVQSTAMYLMSCTGVLPRADFAVFADPGKEKTKTMELLVWLQNWTKENNGIPIVCATDKNLFLDLLKGENSTGQRYSSIPAYTESEEEREGMLRRQCTNEYKIKQVDDAIRHYYNLAPYKRRPKTRVWKGITTDEIERMSIPQEAWKVAVYPYLGYAVAKDGVPRRCDPFLPMSRQACIDWLIANGFPVPEKSSCVFCPYQSNAAWKDLKENHPDDFAAAVLVDRAIRNSTSKGIHQKVYLHKSLIPLEQVDFDDVPSGQLDLWHGECKDDCHL